MSLKRIMVIVLLSTTFLVAGTISPGRFPVPHPVSADSFTLCGSFSQSGWGFSCSSISSPGPQLAVYAGSSVTLSLLSGDGAPHTFCVDYNSNSQCDSPTEPLSPSFNSGVNPTSYTFIVTNTPGTYTYFCTIHGMIMHGSFTVTLHPEDFSMVPDPAALTIQDGTSGSSSIMVASVNGFSGTVTLSTNASPAGLTYSLNQTTVTLSSGSSHPVTLDVTVSPNAAVGSYTAIVTGTNGTISRSTSVSLQTTRPDFTVSSSISSLTVLSGQSTTATITVASEFGYSGTVALSVASNPSGVQVSLSPNSLDISSGSISTSTLAITTTNSTVIRSYQLVVNGTSGSISHTTTITLTVSQIPGTIPLSQIVTVASVVIVVAVVLVGYIVFRGRRRPG